MAKFKIKIDAESNKHYRTDIKTKSFNFTVDEPIGAGGGNEGPGPIDYFLAGLTGCFNVSARIVAKEKGLDIKNIKFEVDCTMEFEHESVVGKQRAIFHDVNMSVSTDAPLDKETLEAWLAESSERCAVSYAVKSPIPVNVKLVK